MFSDGMHEKPMKYLSVKGQAAGLMMGKAQGEG